MQVSAAHLSQVMSSRSNQVLASKHLNYSSQLSHHASEYLPIQE